RIAPSIGVDQSFQGLDQLGVMMDQRLSSGPRMPDSLNGEGALRKALDGPIDGRARKTSNTGDDGNTSSSQSLAIEGCNQVLLSLIEVRKQQGVLPLKFFGFAHSRIIPSPPSFVTLNFLRALKIRDAHPCRRDEGQDQAFDARLCLGIHGYGDRRLPLSSDQGRNLPQRDPWRLGMVQLRVTAIPEVAIPWSSGFSRLTDRPADASLANGTKSAMAFSGWHARVLASMECRRGHAGRGYPADRVTPGLSMLTLRVSMAPVPVTVAGARRETIEQPKRASGRSFASVVTRKRPSLNRAFKAHDDAPASQSRMRIKIKIRIKIRIKSCAPGIKLAERSVGVSRR